MFATYRVEKKVYRQLLGISKLVTKRDECTEIQLDLLSVALYYEENLQWTSLSNMIHLKAVIVE